MGKRIVVISLIFVIMLGLVFQTNVFATNSKLENVLKKLNESEMLKNVNGVAKLEDDQLEIEYSISNNCSFATMNYTYEGTTIEYIPEEPTSYEEAESALSHYIYALKLLRSALLLNGYTENEITDFLQSDGYQPTFEINGFEIEILGEPKEFTNNDDGFESSLTVTPTSIRIDVSRVNLNTSNTTEIMQVSKTVKDVVDSLKNDSDFTTYKDEDGRIISENEITCEDGLITIEHTDYSYDYYNTYFDCTDGVLTYELDEINDFYDANDVSQHQMWALVLIQFALEENGYTDDEIREFLNSENSNPTFEENGIELKILGESKEFSDNTGMTITAVPISIKIDIEKANIGKKESKGYDIKSVLDNDNSISFTEQEGKNYVFDMRDRLSTTDEDLQKMVDLLNDPEYTFEKLKAELNKAIEYGNKAAGKDTLLKLYEIYLTENGVEIHNANGGFRIKIRITDDMKGYDTYKLIYIAEDGTTENAIILTKNGDYLEGTLPHLSMYALVGSKTDTNSELVNTTEETSATTEAEMSTSNTLMNPKTGDNIVITILIFVISAFGVITSLNLIRNCKIRNH